MGFFPTKEAIDLAKQHNTRGARYYHKDIAEQILEQGIHIDDYQAAQYQVQGLDPNSERPRDLEAMSHIEQVQDEYLGTVPRKKRSEPFTKAALEEVYGEED